jgi:hypothetical protein
MNKVLTNIQVLGVLLLGTVLTVCIGRVMSETRERIMSDDFRKLQ